MGGFGGVLAVGVLVRLRRRSLWRDRRFSGDFEDELRSGPGPYMIFFVKIAVDGSGLA